MTDTYLYRQYADGTIVVEDDFDEFDNSLPYYDDYKEVAIPDGELSVIMMYHHVQDDIETAVSIWIEDQMKS